MRVILMLLFIVLVTETSFVQAYYQWYDKNGFAHFTTDDPPPEARNKNGSPWWKINPALPNHVKEKKQSLPSLVEEKKQFERNENEQSPEESPEEKPKSSFFLKLYESFLAIFPGTDRSGSNCRDYSELVTRLGICPLDKIKIGEEGSQFRAKVVDSRKAVWSSCKGTRNGDVYTFVNRGNGYWETDGGFPACPSFQGFYF
jgi:hypothetical protein